MRFRAHIMLEILIQFSGILLNVYYDAKQELHNCLCYECRAEFREIFDEVKRVDEYSLQSCHSMIRWYCDAW